MGKDADLCIIIIISRKMVKITSEFSILMPSLIMRGNSKCHCLAHFFHFPPPKAVPVRRWEGAEAHKLFAVCTMYVRFPYTEHAASGI